ncbi:hypothetical protein [Pseudomonas aeruginosa]|uniref:hypothetical protein n=1 Tax=Pseudomonas aeruginosa TaxID=287 RepID=UPI0029BFF861|nr:hypothetical protein [Pseudomonas aeruginosa]
MITNNSKAPSCTCPSGDGSLVHPCPAHPASVKQAGGDERAAFEAWATHLPMDRQYLRPDLYMPPTQWAWDAWQARAALAQPSPAPTLRAAIDVANDRFEVPVAKWGTDLAEAERPEVMEAYAEIGRAVEDSISRNIPDWSPSDCPSEVIVHLINERDAALAEVEALRAENSKLSEALDRWPLIRDRLNLRLDYALAKISKLESRWPGKEVPQAWHDVQAERCRQNNAEGWTPEHDDLYCAAELPRAAAAYILSGANDEAPAIWPFVAKWWKPRDARANYVRAGALILAEIERLDRAAASQGGPHDA